MHRIVTAAVIAFAAASGWPAQAEILIGGAGPNTGPLAWIGEQMQRGAEMAVADINAAGGVLGQQVQLITADDFCDPEQAVAAAQKLVSRGCDLRRRTLLLRRLDPGVRGLRGGGRAADFAGVDQSAADRAGPRQRLSRHRPRRCARYRGRQLPGRSLGRQEDRDPSRRHDLRERSRRRDQKAVEQAGRDRSDLPGIRPRKGRLFGRDRCAAGRRDRRAVCRRVSHRGRAHGPRGTRSRLCRFSSSRAIPWRPRSSTSSPVRRPRALSSPSSPIRAETPKRRLSSSGFAPRTSSPTGYTLHSYAAVQVWAQAVEKAGSLELDRRSSRPCAER